MKSLIAVALLAIVGTALTVQAQTTWTIPHKDAMCLYRQGLCAPSPPLPPSNVNALFSKNPNEPRKQFVPNIFIPNVFVPKVAVCSIPLLQPAIDPNKHFTGQRLTPREMDAASVIKPAAPSCSAIN